MNCGFFSVQVQKKSVQTDATEPEKTQTTTYQSECLKLQAKEFNGVQTPNAKLSFLHNCSGIIFSISLEDSYTLIRLRGEF